MPRLTTRWAVFGVTALLGLAVTGTSLANAAPATPAAAPADACDPVAPAGCMLPFPNNYFTVPDRHSATGLRVHFDAASMPANVLGQHVDPTEWNRQDGFSPGEPILVRVPGLDAAASHIAPVTDVGASLDPDAPIVLVNARTGQRMPYWAELDAHAAARPDRQVLIIRPAVAMDEGATATSTWPGTSPFGTVTVPSYLTGSGGPGSRLHYGPASGDGLPPAPDSLPTPTGQDLKAGFVCNIPRAADVAHPAHLSLYGHGLLGKPAEINAGNVKDMSNSHDFMFCATSWIGLANDDIGYVASVFSNISGFAAVPDRLQQSFLNFLFLGRAMDTRSGFASDPAFQDAHGRPLIDVRGGLHYDGNSQGGINGGALTAIAQDYTRAVLGVTGMNYSTLLQRSVDFAPFQQIMDGYYPDPIDQQVVIALLQMLWDRGEANGYAQHMTGNPLPRTPKHTVLMHVAFADHQVSNAAAEVEARTIGARVYQPALAPGWTDETRPYWGIAPMPDHPYRGSAMVVWNSGASFSPPPANLAPSGPQYGVDPHEFPRAQPQAQQQKAVFLLTGFVADVCGGAPCPSG